MQFLIFTVSRPRMQTARQYGEVPDIIGTSCVTQRERRASRLSGTGTLAEKSLAERRAGATTPNLIAFPKTLLKSFLQILS